MDVVQQEGRCAPIACPPRRHGIAIDGLDQLSGEFVGTEAGHRAFDPGSQSIPQSVQQVGLPDATRSNDDQRVVAIGGLSGDGPSGLQRHPIAGALEQVVEPPDGKRSRRWMRALTSALGYRLGTGDVLRIAKGAGASQGWGQLRGLRVERLEPVHVGLELAEHLLRIRGHLLLQQCLEPCGTESFSLPPENCRCHLGTPRIHLLGYRGGDLRQEIAELVDTLRLGFLLGFSVFSAFRGAFPVFAGFASTSSAPPASARA